MRVYRGSVKNFFVEKEPTADKIGEGYFEFTDDYSIFDYGKMPDTIAGKGEALARLSSYNFEQVHKLSLKSHFRALVPPRRINVGVVRVLFPQRGELKKGERNFLVPLEIIFRNSLPEGSSVFKRLANGQLKPSDLGLDHAPRPGERLGKPLLDVSTKLELTDRYLSWKDAEVLARLGHETIAQIQKIALKVNDFVTQKAVGLGLEHADGKIEVAISPSGKLVLVDVFGTLDENRLLFEGVHLSKQVLRDYYRTLPWYEKLETAKASGVPKDKWPKPPMLPPELRDIVSNMYKSVCEAWTGEKTWNAPAIEEVVSDYRKFMKKSLKR